MPTVFSPPRGIGWNNATVINTIVKYCDRSIGGFVTGPCFYVAMVGNNDLQIRLIAGCTPIMER
jgi:hypothetical protein